MGSCLDIIDNKLKVASRRLLVVAHDAGGAELLSSFISRNKLDARYILCGPALEIFYNKIGVRSLSIRNLCLEINSADLVLCSTGWQSDLEYTAISLATSNNIPSIAFLDHWVDYESRFIRNGVAVRPTQIWCGDRYSLSIAQSAFTSVPVYLEDNAYFLDIKDRIASLMQSSVNCIAKCLYVCEPTSEYMFKRYGGPLESSYNEYDALKYFFDNLGRLDANIEEVILRPHPCESVDKYNDFLHQDSVKVTISSDQSLLEQIVQCSYVVGCNTMAMVVGLLADRKVISVIPPGGGDCVLPFDEILMMRSIL